MNATSALLSAALALAAPGEAPPRFDLDGATLTAQCDAALAAAREALAAARAQRAALRGLIAVEDALATLDEATVAHRLLAELAADPAVRDAGAACGATRDALRTALAADPALLRRAQRAAAQARDPQDRALAAAYQEEGRRAGAGRDAATREAIRAARDELAGLETAFQRALAADRPSIALSATDLAGLPESLRSTASRGPEGVRVVVGLGTAEPWLRSLASGAARERFERTLLTRGGPENSARLARAVALRARIAALEGAPSWAALRLRERMAGTPAAVAALLDQVAARHGAAAQAELGSLAALKAASGDATPFASWDLARFTAERARREQALDLEEVRDHLPVAGVVPAVLAELGARFGLRFEPRAAAALWAPEVAAYALVDGEVTVALVYLDLVPRPEKFLRPATFQLRAGRARPGGGRTLPMLAIIGNGPAGSAEHPARFSHRELVELFHELGHVLHMALGTQRYAALDGARVRGDFAEAPSQLFEEWAWDPAVLARIARHAERGSALAPATIAALVAARRAGDGLFLTRQAFLAGFDLALHDGRAVADPDALWFALAPRYTPLPQHPDTRPAASFMPVMGGYDADYYGYLWARALADLMWVPFAAEGADQAAVAARLRRAVFAPGASREPAELVATFIGRRLPAWMAAR
jgi:thimet oligopeptidase